MANKPLITYGYWGMAYDDMILKSNILVTSSRPDISPYELWYNTKLDFNNIPMLPFGSIVMAHIPVALQASLGYKSFKTVAIGTAITHRQGLLLYNPITKRIIIRRSFKTLGPIEPPTSLQTYESYPDSDPDPSTTSVTLHSDTNVSIPITNDQLETLSSEHESSTLTVDDYLYLLNTLHFDPNDHQLYKTINIVTKTYRQSGDLHVVAYRQGIHPNGNPKKLRKQDHIPIPIQDIILMTNAYNKNSQTVANQATVCQSTHNGTLPRTIKELNKLSDSNPDKAGFIHAMQSKIKSLINMNVFDSVDSNIESIPKNLIGSSKLVFTKKFHPDGSFDKYKCRMVFRGDRWIDHYKNKTYAGTIMSESVRLFLNIAAYEDLELYTMNIRTAFLYASVPFNQTIYMRRPAGLTDQDMPSLVKLHKCIYGLPMAPAKFQEHLDQVLRTLHFVPSISDPRLYINTDINGSHNYILIHVDDLLLSGKCTHILDSIVSSLQQHFQLSVSTSIDYYLGMLVQRDRSTRTIKISQPGYIEEMIDTYNISCSSYPSTPMIESPRKPSSDTNPLLNSHLIELFQSKVGTLLYLANQTRPDILFAVNMMSRQTKQPTKHDMLAVDRILQYVAGTPTLGLTFHSNDGIVLTATVDASYGSHSDRKSHTGLTLHIGKASGSFLSRSKKQTITADSSTVAEFVATHMAAKEIMWARSLLSELGYPQHGPTTLFEDNKSTIYMIQNDSHTQRTKHIDIRYNLIREQVQKKVISMEHLSTKEMISDMLTKALAPSPFLHLLPQLLGDFPVDFKSN
eukprot:gene25306-33026_t